MAFIPEIPEIIGAGEEVVEAGVGAVRAWNAGRTLQAARRALNAARATGRGIQSAERAFRIAQRDYNRWHPPSSHTTPQQHSPAQSPDKMTPPKTPRTPRRRGSRPVGKRAALVSYSYKRGRMRYRRKGYKKRRGKRSYRRTKKSPMMSKRRNKRHGYHRGRGQLMGPTRAAPRFQLVANNWPYDSPSMVSDDKIEINVTYNDDQEGNLGKYIYKTFKLDYPDLGMSKPSGTATHAYLWKGVKFIINYTIPQGIDLKFRFYLCAIPVDSSQDPSQVLGSTYGSGMVPQRVFVNQSSYKVLMRKTYRIKEKAMRNMSDSSVIYSKVGVWAPQIFWKNPLTVRFVKDSAREYIIFGNNSTKRFRVDDGLRLFCRVLPCVRNEADDGKAALFKVASFAYIAKEVEVLYV